MKTPYLTLLSAVLASALLFGCSAEEAPVEEAAQAPAPAVTEEAAPAAEKKKPGLNVEAAGDVLMVEGVPGGVERQVAVIKATVKKINYENRVVKLVDADGNTKSLRIGPDAVNFDQVKQGDQVEIVYAQELLVYLKEKGAPNNDGVESVIERAPEGEKPQAVAAKVAEMTAVVTAIDLANHTATLKFPEGETRVVQVRPDVEVREDHVGREVVFRSTMATAISVTPAEAKAE